jgi:hypothetical protein
MHELMHGLGPHNISVGGRQTTVRQELKETYSAIEEAKADVSGLWALKQLADQKKVDASIARTMYTTFLASSFRSIRFGINEAHGRGIAIQLNYFLDQGAFVVGATAIHRRRGKMPRPCNAAHARHHDAAGEAATEEEALIDTLGCQAGAAGAPPALAVQSTSGRRSTAATLAPAVGRTARELDRAVPTPRPSRTAAPQCGPVVITLSAPTRQRVSRGVDGRS